MYGFCGGDYRDTYVSNARCRRSSGITGKVTFLTKVVGKDEYTRACREIDGAFYCCRCMLIYTVAVASPVDNRSMHACSENTMHTSCDQCLIEGEKKYVPTPLFAQRTRFVGRVVEASDTDTSGATTPTEPDAPSDVTVRTQHQIDTRRRRRRRVPVE